MNQQNLNDAKLAYKQFQFDQTGYCVEAHGNRSSFEDVWNALTEYWQSCTKNNVLDVVSDAEQLICVVRGWQLAEVYHYAFMNKVDDAQSMIME